jgi:hypothetical protein
VLSKTLEHTLHAALALAAVHQHEYATLEHLLLALLDNPDAAAALRARGADTRRLRTDLTMFVEGDLAGLVARDSDWPGDPQPTAGFHRTVQRAVLDAHSTGLDEVTGAHVLVALFSERESHAVYFLMQNGAAPAAMLPARVAGPKVAPARILVATGPGSGMGDAWARGFAPAIRSAGYQADPAGPSGMVERVTEVLLGRVRSAPLLVADFTYVGDGGVQYLAGFAAASGIPVIAVCRAGSTPDPSAIDDARYQELLVWRTPEDLEAGLAERIVALLGRASAAVDAEGGTEVLSDGLPADGVLHVALQRLLAQGRERGFVTAEELNAILPEDQGSSEFLEAVLVWLNENGLRLANDDEDSA